MKTGANLWPAALFNVNKAVSFPDKILNSLSSLEPSLNVTPVDSPSLKKNVTF